MQRKKIASHWPKAALPPFWNTYSLGFSIMFKRRLHILQSHKESCLMKIPKSTDGEEMSLCYLPSYPLAFERAIFPFGVLNSSVLANLPIGKL